MIPTPNRAGDKWTILPENGEEGQPVTAARGGTAAAAMKKQNAERQLKSPLQLPLFTSPLEISLTGVRKVSEGIL